MHVLKLLRMCYLKERSLGFEFRAVNFVPHPKLIECGGEDAFLSLLDVQCVFDGVGWWKEHAGIDSGVYSAALARSMHYFVEESPGLMPLSSLELLRRAYDSCLCEEIHGTSTALVATLQRPCCEGGVPHWSSGGGYSNCVLDVCSIGDCTTMLMRGGRVVFLSEEQVHSFNFPYQLGRGSADVPEHSKQYRVYVQPGDVLLLGTDGIFDNVFAAHIAKLLWDFVGPVCEGYRSSAIRLPEGNSGDHVVAADDVMRALSAGLDEVVRVASANARDVRCDTPYSDKAIEAGAFYPGGRLDDMTLLGSIIDEKFDMNGSGYLSESGALLPVPYRDWP